MRRTRRYRIAEIKADRDHEEARAQNIFSLRHPRDRFYPQRMNREQGGDESAPPSKAGHRPDDKKKKKNRAGMKQDVREMVSGGVQPEELVIQHVRQRRQRVPIAGIAFGESGPKAIHGKAGDDDWILIDVVLVVVGHEMVAERPAKDEPDETR